MTTDDGDSFTLLEPVGGVAPLVGVLPAGLGVPPLGVGRHGAVLAVAAGAAEGANNTVLVDPQGVPRQPVAGTGGFDRGYASSVPRPEQDPTVLGFGTTGAGATLRITAYGCTAVFSCREGRYTFPAQEQFGRAWFGGDATDETVFVDTRRQGVEPSLWRSVDGGQTFTVLRNVQGLIDAVRRVGRPDFSLAPVPGTRRIFFRLAYQSTSRSGPPNNQLFVSDDLGASWRRVAFGRNRLAQPGPAGTMPVLYPPDSMFPGNRFLSAGPDGHLLIAGLAHPFCSSDGGRTWSAYCRA